jgi:two-component system, NtrC family, sensor histidine kinase HydH
MGKHERATFGWMDFLWVVFLAGLGVLPPLFEIHKQLILLAIGAFQILEHSLVGTVGESRGRIYSIAIKIGLASLLLDHTGGIQSSYYPIYYLPVVTAAMFFGPAETLLWTTFASVAYCLFLLPALNEYELTTSGATELAIRILFFFLAANIVNRFVMENRRQGMRQRRLAEALAETNRRLEQAQAEARRSERLAALGQLSAGLAHELRNPLAIIKGSAETLWRKLQPTDPVTGELAGYISSEVNRANTIVSRFLDFARPLKLDLRPLDVPPLVDAALKEVHDRWPEANVKAERQYAAGLPKVPMDAAFCEQVFTNLVLNAYEAMPEGGQLKVSVLPSESNGHRGVEVRVEDTGPGVPAELREHIFNPFFTTKKTGVGLGLSIVSKIVDDHRGSIRVISEPGKGACFRVFFPTE